MCTSIFQIACDGTHVLSRTMDWPTLDVRPTFVPRNYEWQSDFDHRVHKNQYAIVGSAFQLPHRIDMSDGVNEWGLTAQKLTFANGSKRAVERRDDKVQLAPYEFAFWLLGNFRSVAEIEAHIDEVELMADTYSDRKYGQSELHFAVADRTGRMVAIEPTIMPMRIVDDPLGILTNVPNFEKQIDRLTDYMEFTPEFLAGQVPLNTAKVTTGNLSGKSIPPGSYSPSSRFIRAAYFKERANQPFNEDDAIISSWHLLDGVAVPRNTDHQQTYSVYRAAAVCESRTYYFEPYNRESIVKLQLTDDMLAWQKPVFYDVADELQVTSVR
ncbi:MAG: linear amide C-N hydrolase [Furfurilactobacillus sp.]|uniref:linear amide C-N hydrolase n=1 Tax=Furfurilactobacillus TaxID=2767882 RepID=UPI001F277779|nr:MULTISPECIES: linear amide C-N hydrolase [Furfurilactobacillus]MCF6419397.1 linear amide C-N hydrolase [Furfurilactobacillus milii]MCH4011531.1 linear amide C-N hydrolase [Furfurilactobacillus sp.]MCH4037423.1 linear amide C-N hydrolase [Furfurilactobacillus sp.]MCH4115941.1 linear amide C-N hydrolase [Furfurilactobacillus sp.]MCI1340978.1 linear amide C-N hydrolase [Furfurilactobacillus sp.]